MQTLRYPGDLSRYRFRIPELDARIDYRSGFPEIDVLRGELDVLSSVLHRLADLGGFMELVPGFDQDDCDVGFENLLPSEPVVISVFAMSDRRRTSGNRRIIEAGTDLGYFIKQSRLVERGAPRGKRIGSEPPGCIANAAE